MRDTGLYFSAFDLSPFLKSATTFAFFQSSGKVPVSYDCCIIKVSMGAISLAYSFNILSGISSGPFDLLVSKPFNSFSIPGIVNMISVIDGIELSPISGNVPVFSFVKTLWYCLFRTSALPLLSVTSFPLLSMEPQQPQQPQLEGHMDP